MTNPHVVGRSIRYAIALGLCALPGLAETSCTFETECMEGEDCADSGFTLTIADHGDIVTPAETINVTSGLRSGQATAYSGASSSGFHLVSIAEDGTARYSAHIPSAELTILYIGTCTETG